jgi:hypothetical protein
MSIPTRRISPRISILSQRERSAAADAEGATAPETLRQTNHAIVARLWKVALDAPADGITFSGKQTEGAPRKIGP